MRIYLIDVEQLQDEKAGEELIKRAYHLIDEFRRSKADRCRNAASRALALGAGLALQLAASGYTADRPDLGSALPLVFTAEEAVKILEKGGGVIGLTYLIGESGKPCFKPGQDIPAFGNGIPHFSISHSGKYAALVLSEHETGIDIQQKKEIDTGKLSGHFFTDKESEMIKSDPELFFTIWARKEAFGKCEGTGLRSALRTDLSDLDSRHLDDFRWSESCTPDGYVLCVCEKYPGH